MRKLLHVIMIVALFPVCSFGQYYFGQNKVQYTNFDWQILKTKHFDVYFYTHEEEIAQIAAQLAEDAYTKLTEKFNIVIDKKIPLVIYSHPNYFTQTNIVADILPENVAGFTEFFKERVVIPFDGSYKDFEHVINHELVHVFTMQKIFDVAKSHRKRNPASPPLWFTEGIAEYWSQGWDSQAEMVMRDMAISNKFITFDRIYSISGTFFMYKMGQSICRYLADTYGDDRLTLLFENWYKGDTFEDIFKLTYDKPLPIVGREWEYSVKKSYYPLIKDQDLPERAATKLSGKYYNVKPVVFSKMTEEGIKPYIAYKTIRLGYPNIAIMPLNGENGGMKRLIKGERSAKFESLHFLDSGIDVDQKGQLIFASKYKETDALNIYDINSSKMIKTHKFEGITAINSPVWSSDSKKIAFSGATINGQCDIYIFELADNSLTRLTNDIYFDQTPSFSPDGNYLTFSSDRDSAKGKNIYLLDLKTLEIKQLTFGDYSNVSPKWAHKSDSLIFSSDREGVPNIYLIENPLSGESRLTRITNFATGSFDPVFSLDDSAIVFCAYQDMNYHIYKSVPDTSAEIIDTPNEVKTWTVTDSWKPAKITGDFASGKMKYKTKLSFDIAQSAVAYDAIFGSVGGLQGALTDVLGNHQLYFLFYNTADTRKDFLNSMNVGVTYMNRQRRLNWGLGIYRFYNEYDDDYYGYVGEETYGGLAMASYPFSRYDRVEAATYFRKYTKETITTDNPDAILTTLMLSYIKDTSIWEPSGPIDGFRMHVTLAPSLDMRHGAYYNSTFNFDIRKYFRISESSAYAVRGLYLASDGKDPQRYYLGGSWDLRGYPRRSFYDKNILLWNNELRFPLIDRLYIGFPIGAFNFQSIRGALFSDTGKAWGDKNSRLVGSFGAGIRVSLGYFMVLRFDFSKRTDYKTVFGHGMDFDFFFGWNY